MIFIPKGNLDLAAVAVAVIIIFSITGGYYYSRIDDADQVDPDLSGSDPDDEDLDNNGGGNNNVPTIPDSTDDDANDEPPVDPAPPEPTPPEPDPEPEPEPEPAPDLIPLPAKKWTVLFYVAYDNNIGGSDVWEDDLSILESIGSSADINFVALVDRDQIGDSELVVIGEGTSYSYHPSSVDPDWGDELDTASGDTLLSFLKWGIRYFPAERYNFHLADHGGGWMGACIDDNSESPLIYSYELAAVFDEIKDTIGKKIDVVSFSACFMGSFEFAWEIADSVHFLTGQETIAAADTQDGVTMANWDTGKCWGGLHDNPDWTAGEFAVHQVSSFHQVGPYIFPQVGQTKVQSSDTMCTADLSMIEPLKTSFTDLAQELYDSVTGDDAVIAKRQLILEVIGSSSTPPERNTESFSGQMDFLGIGYMHMFDLRDFVYRLGEYGDRLCSRETAAVFLEHFDAFVISCVHGDNYLLGEHPDAHGMDLYIPFRTGDYDGRYDDIRISHETMWDEFLEQL